MLYYQNYEIPNIMSVDSYLLNYIDVLLGR